MKKEVFINLNSYNLKNTLYTEHLKESRTTGKRTYAGIHEWVELFLIIIFLKGKSQGQASHLKPTFL